MPETPPTTKAKTQAWLRQVLEETGLTANALAGRIKRSPSTLQRFLNDPDYQPTLSTRTIDRIVEVTGIPFTVASRSEPAGMRENPVEPYEGDFPGVGSETRSGVDIWRNRSRALELSGLLPGDLIRVDTHVSPRAGDTVLVQIYDLERGTARTVPRLFTPPCVMTASADQALRKAELVDGERVRIAGVVTLIWRERADR